MKIIGISGAQGAGKSSVLTELIARGWRVDNFKVSRAVQAELGWDNLERVMESPMTMMDFQERVFSQKFKNDSGLIAHEEQEAVDAKSNIILTERTFADILAYTTHWTMKFVDRGDLTLDGGMNFLLPFTGKCQYAQQKIYSGIVLLPLMPHIPWDNDPNRAKKSEANLIYESIESFIDRKMPLLHRKLVITKKTVEERADQVESFLETL